MTPDERAAVVVTARLLRATASMQWLALALTIVSATSFVWGSNAVAAAAGVILGMVAIYYGFRVSFDARLFDDIAAERIGTSQLDAALRAFGKLAPPRTWTDRCRAARRLVVRLAMATVAQVASVIWIGWP